MVNMVYERLPIAADGGHRYNDGTSYVGTWNTEGKRQGEGHLQLPDGTRYDGMFENGLFHGIGVLRFPDGAKYEGEFFDGWFHGYGIFWRSDGMKHEGEFRAGKIWGLGLTTFSDNTNGFPRNEGFFHDCQMKTSSRCPQVIKKAQRVAFMARNQYTEKIKA
ncbi:MORN repeat-containing protein 4 homolog [Diabrotica virgifera virgifera]|uniref:MORN repeat-containing protein 4 homolog n=1 Tax=Diabrotica virgifera virgifera TaxID=50390 RepID=A0ABM5K9Z3_DIAVI|nr:MORN repeat-containing protein 4 homolog [Diabrotica virgifera virgifera]